MTASDWVQVALMVILVSITAFYAWQARRTVKEMEKARFATFRPIIALYVPLDSHDALMSHMSFRFKNVGTSPALNVKLSLRHPRYNFNEHYESAWGAGQEDSRDFYSGTPLEPPFQPTGAFVPEAVYEDVFGNAFQSTLESLPNGKRKLVVIDLEKRAKK
jgi:hypothetical protein